MKSLVQEERLTALIKSSLNLMCKTSLHYDSEVEIKGLLGITLDKKNVFLVDVKEIITLGENEQSDQDTEQEVGHGEEEVDNAEHLLPSTMKKNSSSARNARALKRDRRIVKDQNGGIEGEPKRKKRAGRGHAVNGNNERKQQEGTEDLDFCVVKIEKQEDEDTDLNTSDVLPVSNDAAEASQMADDCLDGDDNGGNEDSDNEVGESVTENTHSTSSKGSSRKATTDGDYNPNSDDLQSDEDNSMSRKLKKVKKKSIPKTKKAKGEERYTCETCNQVFNRPYNLKRHMMKHTGTHIECKHCRKKCYSKWELRKHYEISHVKALQCELCEKTFKSVEGLRRHNLSVHVMSFKYECEICSKGFHQENQLELHFNSTHLNFRFHCKALGCFSSFENKKLLCDHKKKFHPELTPQKPYVPREKSRGDIKQYTCNKCGKTYQWASSLSYHSNVCNADKTVTDTETPTTELHVQPDQAQQLQQQELIQQDNFQQQQHIQQEQHPQQLQQPPPAVHQETHIHQQPQQQQSQQLQIQIHPGQTQLQTLQQVTLPNSVHHQNITFTEPNQIQVQVQEIVPETMAIPSNYVIM